MHGTGRRAQAAIGDLFTLRRPSHDVRPTASGHVTSLSGNDTGTEPRPDAADSRAASLPASHAEASAASPSPRLGPSQGFLGGMGPGPDAAPATARQIGFASDISKALGVPLPVSRDVESIGAFIAHNSQALKVLRGRA